MANTLWTGSVDDKLYFNSGQFTSIMLDSEYVGSIEDGVQGITWDGTDVPWSGWVDKKLYLQSGKFTSTLKTSEDVSSVDTPNCLSWDGTNTPWVGVTAKKLMLTSGKFTSTIITSEDVSAVDLNPVGISYDGADTPWSAAVADKLYLQSGQFTSTIKTSEYIGALDITIQGLSYTGADTLWTGIYNQKLFLTSGKFTSTVKDSETVGSIDAVVAGIDTDDTDARLGIVAVTFLSLSMAQEAPVAAFDTTVAIGAPLSFSTTQQTASFVPGQVMLPATLSLSMAQQSPSAVWDTNIIVSAALGLTAALPIPSQHGDANIDIPAPLELVAQVFTLSILAGPNLFIIIVPDTALELGSASPSPSISISASIDLAPLPLAMDIALLPLTFVIQTSVFVSLPSLPLSFATNAVTVITDTFILLPGVPLSTLTASLSLHAPEVNVTDDIKIIVTNARTFAISEYAAMAFNSMAKFNGKYLYAKADGIYEGGGDDDNGAEIHASYKTGAFNIDATEVQKLRNAFLNFRSNGDMQLFSVGNEVNTRLYNIPNSTADTMHERRKKFERGIRDNHFSFGISNVAGSSFEIKSAKILTEPIRKRR